MPSKQPMGDVIVLLPGILGSVLQRDGRDVFAMTPGAAWRALVSLGRSVNDLELHGDDPSVDDLGDGVTAPRLQSDLHLIPGLWSIDGYSHIRSSIFATFDVVDGQNWFDFPYDWRRDNRVAARHLAERAPRLAARLARASRATSRPSWCWSGIRWVVWWPGTTSKCSVAGATLACSSRSARRTAVR